MKKGTNNVPYSPTLDKMFGQKEAKGRIIQWDDSDPGAVHRLVVLVNRAGGSVLFGATRDRGAWAVTIWHSQFGEKPRTEYCNSADMLAGFLEDLCNIWEAACEELEASQKR